MNGPPASPDDLVALLLDHLRSINLEFRGQEEFELKFFYLDDKVTPRPENDCRDLILGKVRTRLAHQQVSISSEARAPADKRKDLSIQAWRQDRQFNVPVEIKKDSHDQVWTAWKTQLPLYMNSQCQGRAIYLVLWFGHRTCRKDLEHSPKSADEAQRLLNSLVTAHEPSRGITVIVMDLTIPHYAKKTRIRRSTRRP